jgi:hypothetical protein
MDLFSNNILADLASGDAKKYEGAIDSLNRTVEQSAFEHVAIRIINNCGHHIVGRLMAKSASLMRTLVEMTPLCARHTYTKLGGNVFAFVVKCITDASPEQNNILSDGLAIAVAILNVSSTAIIDVFYSLLVESNLVDRLCGLTSDHAHAMTVIVKASPKNRKVLTPYISVLSETLQSIEPEHHLLWYEMMKNTLTCCDQNKMNFVDFMSRNSDFIDKLMSTEYGIQLLEDTIKSGSFTPCSKLFTISHVRNKIVDNFEQNRDARKTLMERAFKCKPNLYDLFVQDGFVFPDDMAKPMDKRIRQPKQPKPSAASKRKREDIVDIVDDDASRFARLISAATDASLEATNALNAPTTPIAVVQQEPPPPPHETEMLSISQLKDDLARRNAENSILNAENNILQEELADMRKKVAIARASVSTVTGR